MSTETTLADELRQIARNLDRAAGISAQYCASGHHTAAIRRAADEIERLRDERDGLEKALGPLAAWEIYGDEHDRPKLSIAVRGVHSRLTIGDVLRARAAIAALAARPADPPDPDRHHADELHRIMAADRPGGGS